MANSGECLDRRNVEDIYGGMAAEASVRMLGGNPVAPNSALEAIFAIVAGVQFETLGEIARAKDALFIDTMCCEDVFKAAANQRVIIRPAAKARGMVLLRGIAGTPIPATIGVVIPETNAEFVLDPAANNPSQIREDGTAAVTVIAKVPGISGNYTVTNGEVVFASTIRAVSGIDQRVQIVGDGLGGGADTEDCEALRARLKSRRRGTSISGNRKFYEEAVLSFPGVDRVCFSGCCGDGCTCSPFVTMYPFFAPEVYPPYGVPPSVVLDDILSFVFGPSNGKGEGLAPHGAIGQMLAACPCEMAVNIYTVNTVNPTRFALIEAAVADVFANIACVGESFCKAEVMQAVITAAPEVCIRDVQFVGDCIETIDGVIQVGCGQFPVASSVNVFAQTPPVQT